MSTEKQKEIEIKLTDKQVEIINGILVSKAQLEQEYKKTVQRESEFIVTLCEAKEVEAVQGIRFEGRSMFVPEKQEEPKQDKKLKKV